MSFVCFAQARVQRMFEALAEAPCSLRTYSDTHDFNPIPGCCEVQSSPPTRADAYSTFLITQTAVETLNLLSRGASRPGAERSEEHERDSGRGDTDWAGAQAAVYRVGRGSGRRHLHASG